MKNPVDNINYTFVRDNLVRKTKNFDKIKDNEFYIPKFKEYSIFIKKNYRVSFLKEICKSYKLKISGNKPDLKKRIYNHLLNSNYAIIIQKNIRRYFIQNYNKLKGPAWCKRTLCMNSSDFFTLDNIANIPYSEFFSYKGKDNSIWGFNFISFYNLLIKNGKDTVNPYTREQINFEIMNDLNRIIKYNKMFKYPVNTILNNDVQVISSKKKIELRSLELFQYIDGLGNYTDVRWFTNLSRPLLIKFIRDLIDIWEYRAQLSNNVKKEICHPYGNPFRYIDMPHIEQLTFQSLQKISLSIIEQFIKKGINRESSNLGASYVLCALTLNNNDAANALPWLYQSVAGIE